MAVSIVLRPLKDFTEEDHSQFAALRELVDFEVPPYQWTPAEERPFRVLTWEDGRLVNHVAILPRTVSVGGTPVNVGGISAVMTHPDARGKGYASAAMRRAAEFIRDDMTADFGLLVCLDKRLPLYSRLGWQRIEDPAICAQESGTVTIAMNSMYLPIRGGTWPEGTVDFSGPPF